MSIQSPDRTAAGQAVHQLGRFQLLRLLCKTERTMLWLVADPRVDQERVLAMPRRPPDDDAALQRWMIGARRAARIDHPGLALAVEVGAEQRWPYIAYDRGRTSLLSECIASEGLPAAELVPAALLALQGLAFAHDSGLAHHDLHAGMLALAEGGGCRLIGFGVVMPPADAGPQDQRLAAEHDVLAFGLVLHHALAGAPALGQADVMRAIVQLPPAGRETVQLPRTEAPVIDEPLRAIVNRASDRQPRQRYRSARTFERALSGWLRTAGDSEAGPMALLLDRLRSVGLLPAMPGGAARAARLAGSERERVNSLAEAVLEDVGLSFELLRLGNSAGVRGSMAPGSGPILTVRRAISLVGTDGLRRAAQMLRAWPGPLGDEQASELARQFELARRVGQVARLLRPPGYDAELVYLLAVMQRLGRLLVHYHFPDEAAQIQRLMQPAPAASPGGVTEPGMGEQAASFAVLGVDIEALGVAVGRYWGLDDAALQMMRRLPVDVAVRMSRGDADQLRCTASCANEVVDAQALPPAEQAAAMQRIALRYNRSLQLTLADVQQAALGEPPASRDDDADDGTAAENATMRRPRPGAQA